MANLTGFAFKCLQMVENDEGCSVSAMSSWKFRVLVLSVTVDYRFFDRLNTVKPELKARFGVRGTGYYSLVK